MRHVYTRTLLLLVLLATGTAMAEPDSFHLGRGSSKDGDLSVGGTEELIVNSYARVTTSLARGATSITIDNVTSGTERGGGSEPAAFTNGDLVMVLQTSNLAPSIQTGLNAPIDLNAYAVGQWEFAKLAGATSGTLTLTAPLVNAYEANVTQVIRVPEYGNVNVNVNGANKGTIKAAPWNGKVGGVVAFLATGTVTVDGFITAKAAGFRGGQYVQDLSSTTDCTALTGTSPAHGQKGEGVDNGHYSDSSPYPADAAGRGNFANGGGGGICVRSGAGGGANAGSGGKGGPASAGSTPDVGGMGGVPLIYSALERLAFGGGGGSGHGRGLQTTPPHAIGGAGGGIIFIRAQDLILNNTEALQANGDDGLTGGSIEHDGGGGGGAGGTIVVRLSGNLTCNSSTSSNISAKGGAGGQGLTDGVANFTPGSGGAGGGGRVFYQANLATMTCPPPVVTAGAPLRSGAGPAGTGTLSSLPGPLPQLTAPTFGAGNPSGTISNRSPTITGTAQPNTQAVIYLGEVELGRTSVDSSGNFSFTIPQNLTDGPYTVKAAITFQGVYSLKNTGLSFTVDATAPMRPVVDTLGNPPGKATSEGMLIGTPVMTYDAGLSKYLLTVSGRAERGSTVKVQQLLPGNPTPVASDTRTANSSTGVWVASLAQPLNTEATYTLQVTAEDAATPTHNVSEPATLSFNLDTNAPTAASLVKVAGLTPAASIGGTCGASLPFVTTRLPLIDGSAEGRSTVSATLTAQSTSTPYPVAQAQASGTPSTTGSWSTTPVSALPTTDDVYLLSVTVKDEAGNPSPGSSYCFALDVNTPPKPVITSLGTPAQPATEGMLLGKLALTLNSGTGKYELSISGTAEKGVTLGTNVMVRQLNSDGTVFATAPFDDTTTNTGNWSVKIPQLDGQSLTSYKLEVTATDAAGNKSAPTTLTFNLDTKAPVAPSVAKVAGVTPASSSGGTCAASVPFVTTQLPLIEGTAEARSTVEATLTAQSNSTPYTVALTQTNGTPGGTGHWSTGPNAALPKPNDVYLLTVTVKDEAGNQSSAATYCFALDATVPAPLSVFAITLGNQSATNGMRIGLAGLTTDGKLRISGSAEAQSTVVVNLIPLDPSKSPEISQPIADAGGAWFYDWSGKVNGTYAVEALVKDAAGNQSDPVSFFFDLDLIRPTVTISGRPDNNSITTARDAVFGFGSSEVVKSYRCKLNGTEQNPCPNPYFFTMPDDVLTEDYTLEVWATDLAGNETDSNTPAQRKWRVDSNQPTVLLLGVGTGIPASGGATNSTAIEFKLQANKSTLRIDCAMDPSDPENPGTAWEEPCKCDVMESDANGPICVRRYSGLEDKVHILLAKAFSSETTTETPKFAWRRYEWEVDTKEPHTFVTAQPTTWVAAHDVRVEYTTPTEARKATFKCQLNDEVYPLCASPFLLRDLPDGPYTLLITATDAAGNVEKEAAKVTWTMDTKNPEAPVVLLPEEGRHYKALALKGTAVGERLSTVYVYLDDDDKTPIGTVVVSDTDNGDWQIVIPAEQKPADGPHLVRLKVTDRAGNKGAMSAPVQFFMDTAPPIVAIDGPSKDLASSSARFQFTANESVTYQCKLDLNNPSDCGAEVNLSDLSEGPHTLIVYAVDEAGNKTETSYSWSVYLGRDVRAEGGGLGCSSTSATPSMLGLLGLVGLLLKASQPLRTRQ